MYCPLCVSFPTLVHSVNGALECGGIQHNFRVLAPDGVDVRQLGNLGRLWEKDINITLKYIQFVIEIMLTKEIN